MVADVEKNQETLKEIEKKRKELGLSQVELAKRIGFSRGYYNMLIHGKKPVSDKLADQLQNVLQEYRKEKESGRQKIWRKVLNQRMMYGILKKQER